MWGGTRAACGILVPRTGIHPRPSEVRAQSPNHWAAREFPLESSFKGNTDAEVPHSFAH